MRDDKVVRLVVEVLIDPELQTMRVWWWIVRFYVVHGEKLELTVYGVGSSRLVVG